ncbi:heterodisulfide reductase-related iron-sulfur binding cluster, partial [Escherichia coli]
KGIPVIATSSTCTFALRDEYPEVLNVDNKGLRDHIELATRWLWRKLDEGKTLPLKPLPLKVAYGFKKENYPTSQAIGAPLFRQIEESGADLVVTDCETCKWQIEMSTSLRCEHPITLLAQALA